MLIQRRKVRSLVIGGVAWCLPAVALADKTRCIDSFSAAQERRNAGEIVSAKALLQACTGEPDCPSVIVEDCRRLLSELDVSIARVTFVAHDQRGREMANARVAIDGQPPLGVGGAPIELDPGEHRFRFELPDGQVVERSQHVTAGPSITRVDAMFATIDRQPSADPARTVTGLTRLPSSGAGSSSHGRRAAAYSLAGTAALGVGAFGYFGLSGRDEQARLARDCSPACSPGDVAAVRRRYLLADVSLTVAISAIAISAYLLITEPSESVTPKATAILPDRLEVRF